MEIKISHREQTAEEREVWERWTAFTDAAHVAPDTARDAERLADRYFKQTGKLTTAKAVESLMPENHPNYPWTRA
jgi:hypothetical protein